MGTEGFFINKRNIIIIAMLMALIAFVVVVLPPDQTSVSDILARIERKNFSGVVLIAYGDKISYEAGYGFASCDNVIANTADTVQAIGSIIKM